ncbi:MAG: HAMP domain-containing sensor histidine kinase [Chloroflexota bacterium]
MEKGLDTQAQLTSAKSISQWVTNLWQHVTKPSQSLSGEDKRQANLLLNLLSASLMLNLIALVIVVTNPLSTTEGVAATIDTRSLLVSFTSLTFLVIAYAFGRSQHYEWGALLLSLAPVIMVLVGLLYAYTSENFPDGRLGSFIYFINLGTVVGSVVLSVRRSIYVAIGNVILIMLLVWLLPQWSFDGQRDEMIFSLIIPGLIVASVTLRQRYLNQINSQIRELERLNAAEQAARKQAEQADQTKSAFLASMSHELRTPLNAIINFSKFLGKEVSGPINDEQKQLVGHISESGQHLLRLINDVLDMSRIAAGSLALYVEDDIDLRDTIQVAVNYVEPSLHDKPVTLTMDLPTSLPMVTGDRKRLLQIFLNILSNAAKFTEEGVISIRSKITANEIEIAIQDTGAGIADEDSEHVFSSFKQTDSGLRQGGGTGLGMPISRELAEAHGGRLWFESERGVGTTFYVTVPLKSALVVEELTI